MKFAGVAASCVSAVLFAGARPAAAQAGVPLGSEFRVNTYTTHDQGYAGTEKVASDSSGNFVVVWQSYYQDGSYGGIFGQRYASSGAALGGEFQVNTYTTNAQTNPNVASDPAGNFVVVWQSAYQDFSSGGIFGRRYASSGAPLGAEFQVNTYTTYNQAFPSVASNSSGSFVVVWQSRTQDGSLDGIFGQRFTSSGAPLGPEFRVNTYTSNNQRYPSVASDSPGNFVVVWQSYKQDDPSNWGVFGQRYAGSGVPLGVEFRVNTFTTGIQRSPNVASDPSGTFVVVWHSFAQDSPTSFGVVAQRYASSGAPAGAEWVVNTFTTSHQESASVAMDSSGNFVVVWESVGQAADTSSFGVFGQRYTSSGAPAGSEFVVNTYTTNTQGYPSVASDSSGNFVVVWQSGTSSLGAGLDGSRSGVSAQRFGRIVPVELTRFTVE